MRSLQIPSVTSRISAVYPADIRNPDRGFRRLKSEQKWNCLHCTSPTLQNYDLFIPFFTFLARNRKFMRIRIRTGQKHADLDPKPWNICILFRSVNFSLIMQSQANVSHDLVWLTWCQLHNKLTINEIITTQSFLPSSIA